MAISDRITSIEEHIKESYQELEGIGIDTTKVDKNLENIPKLIDGYWETLPKVTGEGTAITLDNTKEGKMKIVLKGNTSQEGTPTPETPQDIHVVSGDNSINVVGKNLLSFANITNNTAVGITRTVNQETITLNGTTTGAGNIVAKTSTGIILKAGTYTGSITTSGSYNRPNGDVAFYLRKDNTISGMFDKSLINMTTNGQYSSTFTLTEDTEVFLEIYTNASNITFNNYVCKFQIEKSSSASEYEHYQGNTYNIDLSEGMELCKIGTYQDSIVKDNGKWYVKKEIGKVVLNGSESWDYNSTTNSFVNYNIFNNIYNKEQYTAQNVIPQVISNYYTPITWQNLTSGGIGLALLYANNTLQVRLSSSYTSKTDFKNWLSTHNTIVYYVLATPTYTEITDSTLISQLNALAKSYASQTNISQESNDLASLLNATALSE